MKLLIFSISLLAVSALISACSDEMRSHYVDKRSAVEEGKLVEKGWMPVEIPETSRKIREWHNLDVNTGAGSFTFETGELTDYLTKMTPFVVKPEDVSKIQGLGQREGSWKFFRVRQFVIGVEQNTGEGFWYVNAKVSP